MRCLFKSLRVQTLEFKLVARIASEWANRSRTVCLTSLNQSLSKLINKIKTLILAFWKRAPKVMNRLIWQVTVLNEAHFSVSSLLAVMVE